MKVAVPLDSFKGKERGGGWGDRLQCHHDSIRIHYFWHQIQHLSLGPRKMLQIETEKYTELDHEKYFFIPKYLFKI